MATTANTARRESRSHRPVSQRPDPTDEPVVSRACDTPPEQLELISDDYALGILEALSEGPKRGRDLIEACDASRATIYRRLDRLADAGFVRGETTLDPDGHHCKMFELVRSDLTVTIENGALTVVTR